MHVVKLLPAAQRDLDKLEQREYPRIMEAIEHLGQQPRPMGCQKLTGQEGYRIRVGDRRVLYRIDDGSRAVYVYRVRHRREAYR